MARQNIETRLQIYVVKHIRPLLPKNCMMHSIPNEQKGGDVRQKLLNLMGRRSGAGDLFFAWHDGEKLIAGYCELKKDANTIRLSYSEKNKQNKSQLEFEKDAKAAGMFYFKAWDFEGVVEGLRKAGITLRGRVQ